MKKLSEGILVLADGTVFEGIGIGYEGYICGEVVFNTAQTGYQEILTDPSYASQIIVFTQPHIGNVGVNLSDMESSRVFAKGLVVRSFSRVASSWRSQKTLESFLLEQKIMALSEVDTRALTYHLRKFGSQGGCIMVGSVDVERACIYAKKFSGLPKHVVGEVTTSAPYHLSPPSAATFRVVVYDFGVKKSILKNLLKYRCGVTVIPSDTAYEKIQELNPDGIVLSNGPGDPRDCSSVVDVVKKLLHSGIPIMGICLGHQLLALAGGASIQKMCFGHHGANHPIQTVKNGHVKISSQNHGFVVSDENLPKIFEITHRSHFDSTIAGIKYKNAPAFGFQGHPEGAPGPNDLMHLFDEFIELMRCFHAQKR